MLSPSVSLRSPLWAVLALLAVSPACSEWRPTTAVDGIDDADAGVADAGGGDAGAPDVGAGDAGPDDTDSDDAGSEDAGSDDAGSDAGTAEDAGSPDAGDLDAGTPDGGGGPVCIAEPEVCELTQGVCADARRACFEGEYEPVCTEASYGPDYEAFELQCDGLDNDCDGLVDRHGWVDVPLAEDARTLEGMAQRDGGAVAVYSTFEHMVVLQPVGEDFQPVGAPQTITGSSRAGMCSFRFPEVLNLKGGPLVHFMMGGCDWVSNRILAVRLGEDGYARELADGGFVETLVETSQRASVWMSAAHDGTLAGLSIHDPENETVSVQLFDSQGRPDGAPLPVELPPPPAGVASTGSARITVLDEDTFALAVLYPGATVVQRYSAAGIPLGVPVTVPVEWPRVVSAGRSAGDAGTDLAMVSMVGAPDGGKVVEVHRGVFFDGGVETWLGAGDEPAEDGGLASVLPSERGPVVLWREDPAGRLWAGAPGTTPRLLLSLSGAPVPLGAGVPIGLAHASAGDILLYTWPHAAARFCAP